MDFQRSLNAPVATATTTRRRRFIASVFLLATSLGAMLGITLVSCEQNERTNAAIDTRKLPSSVTQRLPPDTAMQDHESILSPGERLLKSDLEPPRSNSDPISQKAKPTSAQTAKYLAQITRLRTENNSLYQKIDRLGSETINLNNQLLKLELARKVLDSKAQPPIQVRTVYNFINQPAGGLEISNIELNDSTESDEQSVSYEVATDNSVNYEALANSQVSAQRGDLSQSQDSVQSDDSALSTESIQREDLSQSADNARSDDSPLSEESIQHDDTSKSWETQFEMEFVESLVGPSGTGEINE